MAAMLLAQTGSARAEGPRGCVEAVERGQALRDQVKLLKARSAFLVCASSTCPGVIQRDCAQWVSELDARIPTVILSATDPDGRDVIYASVSVDGEPFAERLDGIAVPIDPGIHAFHIEAPGRPPFDQTVVVREAEKYQKERFVLPVASLALAPPSPAPPLAHRPPPAPVPMLAPAPGPDVTAGARSAGSGYKTAAIISGSVAGAAALSFLTFALVGTLDDSHLSSSCYPNCSPSSVDRVHRELEAADISLGIGVAALATAAVFFFEWRAHRAPPRLTSVAPASLGLRF